MDLRVLTHSGEDLVITVDTYDAADYEMKLNDNTLNAVKIGDTLFSRIDLKLIKPLPVVESPIEETPPTEEPTEENPTEEIPVNTTEETQNNSENIEEVTETQTEPTTGSE